MFSIIERVLTKCIYCNLKPGKVHHWVIVHPQEVVLCVNVSAKVQVTYSHGGVGECLHQGVVQGLPASQWDLHSHQGRNGKNVEVPHIPWAPWQNIRFLIRCLSHYNSVKTFQYTQFHDSWWRNIINHQLKGQDKQVPKTRNTLILAFNLLTGTIWWIQIMNTSSTI